MKRNLKWLIPIFLLLTIFAAATIYIRDDHDASPSAAAVLSDSIPGISIIQQAGRIVFRPEQIRDGLIFYPGGKVDFIAYTPLMKELAAHGFLCVLMEMPLQLAFLDMNAADKVYEDFPDVQQWYLAGHSLGGVAASSYASKHTEHLGGLVLLASYSTADLKNSGLKVLSIYGSEDGVLNRNAYEKNRDHLPGNAAEIIIPGGNHASFGDYGPQKGDGGSGLDNGEQIQITADIISGWAFAE